MPVDWWCTDIGGRCEAGHIRLCSFPAATPGAVPGGKRILDTEPAFDGPPVGLQRFGADSMDARKAVDPWQDASNKRLALVDRTPTYFNLRPCYDWKARVDLETCEPPLHRCQVENERVVVNCGWHVDGGPTMHRMECQPYNLPKCPRPPMKVIVEGHQFTGRTAFVGMSTAPGERCISTMNILCFGKEIDRDGADFPDFKLGVVQARRWDIARMDWSGARLLHGTGPLAPPQIESDLQDAALAYVAANAGTLGVGQVRRPSTYNRERLDWWESTWNLTGDPIPCDELPIVAVLPGAMLARAGCNLDAELVLQGVRMWMSLLIRHERPVPFGGLGGVVRQFFPSIQIGMEIDLAVRARIVGDCSVELVGNCDPRGSNGEPVVFDWDGAYRPPRRVRWLGEQFPDRQLAFHGAGGFSINNTILCNQLRDALTGWRVAAKPVGPDAGLELYDGGVQIGRIGD